MSTPTLKSTIIENESRLGVYVWEIQGKWVGDSEGRFLSVTSTFGNRAKIDALTREVRMYGIHEGRPLFLPARRKVSDEEREEQEQRLKWGLTPDKLDIGDYKDGIREARNAKRR